MGEKDNNKPAKDSESSAPQTGDATGSPSQSPSDSAASQTKGPAKSIGTSNVLPPRRLTEELSEITAKGVQELPPMDKIRAKIGIGVLFGSAALILITWLIYAIFGAMNISGIPESCGGANPNAENCTRLITLAERKLTVGQDIFEFAKTAIPPIITLVLGYYFASKESATEDSES